MMTRVVTAMLVALPLVVAAGCGGRDEPPPVSPGLTVFTGKGFTVGYPKGWRQDPGNRIFRGADFEVLRPEPPQRPPQASWSVFTEERKRPMGRMVDAFVALSKTARDFRLVERRRLRIRDADAQLVRKSYSAPHGEDGWTTLHQTDLFVDLGGSVAAVRMIVIGAGGGQAGRWIDDVVDSFRVTA
ncbi:hypothetical protein [Actinomadura livida]|uniref:Lipoprotein n=1 Tax=Actinomadura livida TaxID=79909 RepID=A0A7W7IA73_9ACTN|nr:MULTISPECIES: hypothetical protein [Actinomadura]MBB4773396.1 hypothetical protein [Actinomadura catellatispora]GGU07917.1 hypothetical protein GCM10010208_35340 [Actinomadura livida]